VSWNVHGVRSLPRHVCMGQLGISTCRSTGGPVARVVGSDRMLGFIYGGCMSCLLTVHGRRHMAHAMDVTCCRVPRAARCKRYLKAVRMPCVRAHESSRESSTESYRSFAMSYCYVQVRSAVIIARWSALSPTSQVSSVVCMVPSGLMPWR
jgi:hypothetical protein